MKTAYLTFSDFFAVLKKNLLSLLLTAALLAGVGFGIRMALPTAYSATISYSVRNMQGEEFVKLNGLTTSQLSSVQTLCKEYAVVVETHDALYDRTLSKLQISLTREELREMVSATSDSTLLLVTVTDTDPEVVNAVAAVLEAEVAAYINETMWPNLSMDSVVLASSASPAERSSASPLLYAVLFGLAGGLVAYLFFLFRFLFGDTLRDIDEVKRVLPELPLLGELAPDRLYALRTNIMVGLRGNRCPVLGVVDVAGTPGTLVNALAGSLAGAEKQVLILDLKSTAPEDEGVGLYDYLKGEVPSVDALLHPCEAHGVMYLPGGYADHFADLLATDRMQALLRQFAEACDYILIDFNDPAVGAILSGAVSGYVLVAATRETGARALRSANATLRQAEGNVLGLAVADTARKK